jgi:uncharacterized membrane protein
MIYLYLGLILFGGSHLFSVLFPSVRNRLSAWLGENRYKGVYSLSSVLGLALMGVGYWQSRCDGSMLYAPFAGARHFTMLLVLLGFILIASNAGKGYLRLWLQHPFSIGVCLWAIGHLLVTGKTPVVLIYATLLLISVLDIVCSFQRRGRVEFKPEIKRDIIAVVAGLIVSAIFLFGFHPYILGVPVVG